MTAVIVGDRARLPSGFDLTGNRIDAQPFSGRAVDLDGSADFLLADAYSDSSDYCSGSVWIYCTAYGNAGIFCNTSDNKASTRADTFLLYTESDGTLRLFVEDDTNEHRYTSSFDISLNTWYHVAFTIDGSDSANFDVKLYVDGKLQSGSHTGAWSISTGFCIGRWYSYSYYFQGSIADVKLYNVELTAAQVLDQYQNPEKVLPEGVASSALKRWYPLSDYDTTGADSLDDLYLQDCSGNGKSALATGGIMQFSQPNIPQLGLRSSSSRVLVNNASGKQASATLQSAPGTTYSVSCWFMEMANDDTNVLWRMGGTTSTDDDFLEAYINSSGVLTVFGDGTVTAGSPSIGEWHHLVVVSDGSSPYCKVYLDNSEVSTSGALGQAVDISTATLIIGDQAPTLTAFPFDGIISEVAVWNSALSSGNVSTLWNSGVQGADANTVDGGNLLNWYKCDNPVTLTNLSDNSTHAATYAATDQKMVTVPESTTADLSAFGTLTNKRYPGMWNGKPCVASAISTEIGNVCEMPSLPWGTANFTIHFWYRLHYYPGDNTRLFDDREDHGVAVWLQSNTVTRFYVDGTSANVDGQITVTAAQQIGTWVQLVLRREGSSTFSYVVHPLDQSAVSTSDSTGTDPGTVTSTSDYGMKLGGGSDADSQRFGNPCGAQFAFFRCWQGTAITDAEVNALYESGARMLRGT